MTLSIIVAIAADGAIGRGGDQPFYISEDLRHFKSLTTGHPIIMGRKTFQALPKGALPGRRNIVISRDPAFTAPGAEVVPSIEAALALVADVPEAFIIGGATIYALALPLASSLYVTRIDATVPDADTWFPAIDAARWHLVDRSATRIDPKLNIPYRFEEYTRE